MCDLGGTEVKPNLTTSHQEGGGRKITKITSRNLWTTPALGGRLTPLGYTRLKWLLKILHKLVNYFHEFSSQKISGSWTISSRFHTFELGKNRIHRISGFGNFLMYVYVGKIYILNSVESVFQTSDVGNIRCQYSGYFCDSFPEFCIAKIQV